MKAIHGGKAKNDRIDANKIARLLHGGNPSRRRELQRHPLALPRTVSAYPHSSRTLHFPENTVSTRTWRVRELPPLPVRSTCLTT
jgi:hypothetical protein